MARKDLLRLTASFFRNNKLRAFKMQNEMNDKKGNPSGVMADQFYSSVLEFNCYGSEHKERTPRRKSIGSFKVLFKTMVSLVFTFWNNEAKNCRFRKSNIKNIGPSG